MSLSQKIAAALDGPGAGTHDLPCDVALTEGRHRLSLRLTASGPVGLAFGIARFPLGARNEWTARRLRAWGDRIAARVTYLMEPLVVLEQDSLAGEVALRSHAPTARGEACAFYEVRIDAGGTLRLTRQSLRRRHPPPPSRSIA